MVSTLLINAWKNCASSNPGTGMVEAGGAITSGCGQLDGSYGIVTRASLTGPRPSLEPSLDMVVYSLSYSL